MMTGIAVRIFRWEQAPNELKRAAVAATRQAEPGNLIVWIPAHRRTDDPPRVSWLADTETSEVDLDNGDRLIVGTVRAKR